ncbi:MAG: 3-deoxy-7-phosphoheptulonate synthase [Syntrophomonadaceae bacterium]|jgi:3-deoxy-7-phosphoheptulonate synthase|nr:3-deoxy-7-phosphoheptulonate synthase [Syntrophomonadaceae bacterium]
MVVVMERNAGKAEIEQVQERLRQAGFNIHLSQGVERTIIGAIGDRSQVDLGFLEALPGVEKVVPVLRPFKLTSREFKNDDTVVAVRDRKIGDGGIQIIAGPCAVESREKYLEVAVSVKEAGATMLRGGAFKPRTSPYSFQGLEEEGLKILAEARELTGLPVITEVMDQRSVELVARYADVLQIGARNMQNFFLLREVGQINKPIVLKRGPSATLEEWIMAAEYVVSSGNTQVIMCERGIRTFETYTRNTLDLSAIPALKRLTHLPVIVDPSHGTGKWRLVEPMALAAVAAGCDGLMIEVHQNPAEALSDGPQSLTPQNFAHLMSRLDKFLENGRV